MSKEKEGRGKKKTTHMFPGCFFWTLSIYPLMILMIFSSVCSRTMFSQLWPTSFSSPFPICVFQCILEKVCGSWKGLPGLGPCPAETPFWCGSRLTGRDADIGHSECSLSVEALLKQLDLEKAVPHSETPVSQSAMPLPFINPFLRRAALCLGVESQDHRT